MTGKHNSILNTGKLVLLVILALIAFSCAPVGTSIARGWSGAAVDGTTIYIGSMDGKIMAVNTADGKIVWEAPIEVTAPSGGFGCAAPPAAVAIYGSPAVSGNLVYTGAYNGKFYAFARGEQEPRWVYPREGLSGTEIVGGALVTSDKVIFGTANGKVYALNAATGSASTGWMFPQDNSQVGKIWSAPASLDDMVFVSSFDRNVYALDIATGQKKWSFATKGAMVASPVTDNDTVYIGSFDRTFYAVDAATGREKWKFTEAKNWYWAQPLINDGKIFAANLDGSVYVLDVRTGKKLAQFDLSPERPTAQNTGAISSSPVLVGNRLIVATESGNVTSFNASGTDNKPLWSHYLAAKVDAPLSTDGTAVYVHTITGSLHALNAQTGGELWRTLLKGK